MRVHNLVINGLNKLLLEKSVISIYGAAGTGKTTFALQLVGSLLTKSYPYNDQCVWVQASETFSKRRLSQIFHQDIQKLEYLRKNIFIIPSEGTCLSYLDQSKLISKLYNDDFLLPPGTKFIVIDNISHHLRFEISKVHQHDNYMKLVNSFFTEQLYPLIMCCERNHIRLIFIHEVSYNPDTNKNVPFLHNLFSRINCITIVLSKNKISQEHKMIVKYNDHIWTFGYHLKNVGLIFR